ncbi:hypothetical protein [Hyalangium rubrum]|uniref:Transglycosylase SLT domain-containing protein n=1 Tax=Hyalangium rubrum TaxID=3103134 RepID=A0ABU5H3Q6_9BACT|nr:hypothetical protein [Hyalangium sp. s54d21]MDY7226720.1 hypothetical protein [Hyalangium sp. s54d21]
MTASKKVELKIEPGFEGVIRLVAVPPITLELSLDRCIQDGRKYTLLIKGKQKNLSPPGGGEAPQCRVLIKAKSQGIERTCEVGAAMNIQGESCGIAAVVDALEAGFIGKGTAELSVVPDFPFAEACKLSGVISFDNPLDILGADAGQKVHLGKLVKFEPRIAPFFKTVKLRLSVFHTPSPKARRATPYSVFEWTQQEGETRTWRTGCAESDGAKLLTYLETNADQYAYDFVLEAFDEQSGQEVRYLLWDRPSALRFPKPVLKSFSVEFGRMTAELDNIDPGYKLPLELSLWRHDAWLQDPILEQLHVMNPVTRPAEALSSSMEFFFDLADYDVLTGESHFFGMLRIPRSLSGTENYVPISTVMKFDAAQFLPFDDDELWLEPQKKKGGPGQSKQLKTPKELATAVASSELKLRPQRLPHFGAITAGTREKNLLVSFKVVGEPVYWKDASPVFSVQDATGKSEVMKLDAKPTAENPRLYEALVPLDDKRIHGQKVKLQAKVSNPNAKLWGESVAAPPPGTLAYEGTPRLSDVTVKAVKLTDATSYLKVQARARHIPTGKSGATLAFRIQEIASDLPDPIPMPRVKFRYDLLKGEGGQCDSQGLLQARITDPLVVEELEPLLNGKGKGKFRLEACVVDNQGKVLNTDVPPVSIELGNSPNAVAGALIFGKLVPREFRQKVFSICADLKVNAQHLMACMAFETGREFSASTKNRAGHAAYGLIQFTPTAAKTLGTTVDVLKGLSEVAQLDYVHKYFRYWIDTKQKPLATLSDVYACIICPAAIGKPEDFQCYVQGGSTDKAFTANKNLARGKTFITKEDITVPVQRELDAGREIQFRFVG